MDLDSFPIHKKWWHLYLWLLRHCRSYVETKFDTWNYELDRPLPKGNWLRIRNKKKMNRGDKWWQNSLDENQELKVP